MNYANGSPLPGLGDMIANAQNAATAQRNANIIAKREKNAKLEMERLQDNYEAVKHNQAVTTGHAQSAINIIMKLAGVSFEEARQMIINEPHNDTYIAKAKKWINSKECDGGILYSSRKALES